MKNFNFIIQKNRQIDYDNVNHTFLNFIIDNEPSFAGCMSCGACTATCTAGAFSEFSLRKLNINIRLGEIENIRTEIEKCMLCGKCQLVCPRGINTRNVIRFIHLGINKINTL